jgi:hypothetical protein
MTLTIWWLTKGQETMRCDACPTSWLPVIDAVLPVVFFSLVAVLLLSAVILAIRALRDER